MSSASRNLKQYLYTYGMKDQLLQSQLRIFKYMKKRAQSFESEAHTDIKQYQKAHEKISKRSFKLSKTAQLHLAALKASIIYIGDFHTYDQNLKNFLRLLKFLSLKKRKIILALEMVAFKDSHYLQSFLEGHITELEFLESINYRESWRFPWGHYKTLFDYVKTQPHITIYGINCSGKMKTRDLFAAQEISKLYQSECGKDLENSTQRNLKKSIKKNNNANIEPCIIVLYGEYHIVPQKIPNLVQQQLKNKKIKDLIIHQNLDSPYWKVFKKINNVHHQSLIKFNNREFCILSSPPWMKYESQCYWYESLLDDPEYDLHEQKIDFSLKALSSNTIDNFLMLCEHIIKTHQLKIPKQKLHFALYDFTKMNFIEKFITQKYSHSCAKFILQVIEQKGLMLLPGEDKIFCANYSVNKLAKLAGAYIFQFYNKKYFSLEKIISKHDKHSFFCFYTLYFFYAHFFAKSINPYIKCDLFLDLKDMTKKNASIKLALNTLEIMDVNANEIKKTSYLNLYLAAQKIGELSAESFLHLIFSSKDKFDPKQFQNDMINTSFSEDFICKFLCSKLPRPWFKLQRKRFF